MHVSRTVTGALVALVLPLAPAAAPDPGDEVVGQVTGHVTRAFAGGPLVESPQEPTAHVPGPDDADVTRESTLGNGLAEELRARAAGGRPDEVDVGVLTPTALRGDLLYDEPDPDWSGEWWDPRGSLVRRSEVEAVLPTPDEVWLTTLTGAQLDALLEEQWPTADPRPAVHLGLSAGFSYAYDTTRPPGDRVVGVLVGGRPVDPAAPYRVAAPARLVRGPGADGVTVLTQGSDPAPTGRTDRQVLEAALALDLVPDYAERGVGVADVPTTVVPEQDLTIELSGLGSTSHGAPRPEHVSLALGGVLLREFHPLPADLVREAPVTVTVPVPAGVPAGPTALRIGVDERAVVEVPVTVAAGRLASTTALAGGGSTQVHTDLDPLVTLRASVTPSDATGVVDFVADGRVLGSHPLADGVATHRFAPAAPTGTYRVVAHYRGDARVAPSQSQEARVTVTPVVSGTTLTVRRPAASWLPAAWASDVRLDTGAQPVGYVELREGERVLTRSRVVRGLALGVVPALPAGAHRLTAVFVPDARPHVLGSRSPEVTVRR